MIRGNSHLAHEASIAGAAHRRSFAELACAHYHALAAWVVGKALGGSCSSLSNAGWILLSLAQMNEYEHRGVLLVDLPHEVQEMQAGFLSETARFLKRWHDLEVEPDEVAQAISTLAVEDRSAVGLLYRASRRFPSAKRLASCVWAERLTAQIMGTTLVSCCNFTATRIDLPGETRFATVAHQDFPYIQGSRDGVTIWMPLREAPLEMGPPSYMPGSHRLGVAPVIEHGREADASGSATVSAVDEPVWSRGSFESVGVARGQALVFSTLLVHRSEANTTDKARISLQARFDNLGDEDSRVRGYPEGLFLNEPLSASYPEYVVTS